MGIRIKTKEDIALLREGGRRHAEILRTLSEKVKPGITTGYLNELAEAMIREGGDVPAFLNYTPQGARAPYPASICISVNDEIVHGIPGEYVLQEGDIVSLDLGLTHKKMITDAAVTLPVGKVSKEKEELLFHTEKALEIGIRTAKGGATVYDVGEAIERYLVGHGISIIEDLCGHGVGYSVHEDPFVPNYAWEEGRKIKLVPGMVLAIEPITTYGKDKMEMLDDGFTYVTKTGFPAAHFEHTILITKGEPEVLTI